MTAIAAASGGLAELWVLDQRAAAWAACRH
ncbi:hypothetical protein ABIC47_003571 [Leifsonia sp. 563]